MGAEGAIARPASVGTVAGAGRKAGIGGVATPVVSIILLRAGSGSTVSSIMQEARQYVASSC
jgi:hypothetical protein